MAFSSGNSGGPMADINVTPLVDVMLVLLIIFIITAPLMSHKVKVDLPEANLIQKPEDAEKRPTDHAGSQGRRLDLLERRRNQQADSRVALGDRRPADPAAAAEPAW
jgi:hypothetical protein